MAISVPPSDSALLAEGERLEVLRRIEILDTPREEEFDDLVALAAELCGAPVSLMTLVDSDRVFHKAAAGADPGDVPREDSFCTHAIMDGDLTIVPDASVDPRFAENPNVTDGLGVRFYAGAPLVTPEGAAIGSLCVIDHRPRDLTPDQERALRALSRAVVAQLELRRQNERLKALDRLKDEFVAVVAHDLRTPLTSIRGYLELLIDGGAGELSEEQQRFLTVVDRNSKRLMQLVGDLLFLAQIEAGKLALELGEVDLDAVIADCLEAAKPMADEKGITLESSAERLPSMIGDRGRLAQVLDNLVSNALKFTGEGGTVTVRASSVEGNAVIEVEDTGMGIAPEEQEQLFDRFFRSPEATERAIPGTGLGLTIAKAIVERHEGSIEVESVFGKGTTMRVLLPVRHPHRLPEDVEVAA
jgi:signal transduction histidine kinase